MNSITLKDLVDCLQDYLKENPEDGSKMIFHDGLHLEGKIQRINEGTILELI